MKIIFLAFALLFGSVLYSTAAVTFSCRDSFDVLHIADNLMSLPEECRDQAITSNPEADTDKVSYVPEVQQSQQQSDAFHKAVAEEEQAIQAHKQKAEEMVLRAQYLATSFENGVKRRKAAVSSNQYGSRDTILQADQEIQTAREEKKSMLAAIDEVKLSGEQRQQVETLLNTITE